VGSDVDDRARAVDAADQLGLVVGAACGIDARLAELLQPLVGRRALEDAREVVGDDDERLGRGGHG